jgi:maltose O-acetyltransferase
MGEMRDRMLRGELYGAIGIGDGTFVNVDAVMLDVAPIEIGAACQIGPRVRLLTATHPIDPGPRRAGWESGAPIAVADNAWLGGGVIVCPGVTIGRDSVVGAGAVVTRDVPAGVLAAGEPARVLREIGEGDRIDVPERSTARTCSGGLRGGRETGARRGEISCSS